MTIPLASAYCTDTYAKLMRTIQKGLGVLALSPPTYRLKINGICRYRYLQFYDFLSLTRVFCSDRFYLDCFGFFTGNLAPADHILRIIANGMGIFHDYLDVAVTSNLQSSTQSSADAFLV